MSILKTNMKSKKKVSLLNSNILGHVSFLRIACSANNEKQKSYSTHIFNRMYWCLWEITDFDQFTVVHMIGSHEPLIEDFIVQHLRINVSPSYMTSIFTIFCPFQCFFFQHRCQKAYIQKHASHPTSLSARPGSLSLHFVKTILP